MPTTMHYGPVEIWNSMGVIGHLVLTFLLLMSIYSIAVMLNRYLLFEKAQKESRSFVREARAMLKDSDIGALRDAAAKCRHSHLARIYSAAIADLIIYRETQDTLEGFEPSMRRAMEREAVLVTQDFKRGLSGLASIGATAPFVGLFGTVVGIMNSFFSMAVAGAGGIATVAGGIAEALVNTAAGLFVALPAVWGFNYFLGRMERLGSEMDNGNSEFVDYCLKHGRRFQWHSAETGRTAT
jgi:biopolymer transport protein ExbB/TolQ